MTPQFPERFHVAFSFAGEQRALVKQIAEAVQSRLGEGTVFFDEWYEDYIAGLGSDKVLQDVYENRSLMVVVCVSEHYADKAWTQTEHDAIGALNMRIRASKSETERLRMLPLRVGDGDVPGIPINAICPDARRKSPEETAQLIVNRFYRIVPPPAAASGNTTAAVPAMIAPLRHDTGPMSPGNPWYVERKVDQQLLNFLNRDGRTAALLGAPQMGKSSLATRIEQRLQELGYHRVSLNVRGGFTPEAFADEGQFFAGIALAVARILHIAAPPPGRFAPHAAPVELAAFFVDEILPKVGGKVLIVFDRFDHLFDQPCSLQALSGLRALHDMTADPPLDNLRMILIYTIRPQQEHGPHGSVLDVAVPFEVGDFTPDEVRHLNSLHGNLLRAEDMPALHQFLGGHPLLTRQAWNAMAANTLPAQTLIDEAKRDGGIFKPHLRSILAEFQKPHRRNLAAAFRNLITGQGCASEEVFDALLTIGVVNGTFHGDATVRCGLYASWFPPRLP